MNHELKIWPQYYTHVASGSKTFEVRDNDRGFQQGDTVTLKEWDPRPKNSNDSLPVGYTGAPDLQFKVGYVHVLSGTFVVFSLIPLPKAQKTVKKASKKAHKSKA